MGRKQAHERRLEIMGEGYAIVIAAVVSVGGMVLIQFINYLQRKIDFKEQLFFVAYQKRIEVYEDVIKELQNMRKPDMRKIANATMMEATEVIIADVHILSSLITRLCLFGSPRSVEIIIMLHNELIAIHEHNLGNAGSADIGRDMEIKAAELIENAVYGFSHIVSKEAGANFVDKRIGKTLKDTAREKIDNKPGGDGNEPVGDHKGEGVPIKEKVKENPAAV
jgi:hypothetical protein